jgi:membrane protein implicated in regulation of membrane protease activity
MNISNTRMQRLTGLFLLVVAIAIPSFLLPVAGIHAFITGITPVGVLVTFGALLLSGRWPDRSRRS